MRLRGDQNVFAALLAGLSIPLIGYGYLIPGLSIALAGSLFLVRKKYYSWAAIIFFFLVIICATSRYPIVNSPLPISAFFLLSIAFECSIYIFRVKNHLKEALKNMDEDASFELLPFNVNTYYRNLYNFHRPFMIRIWWKKNGIKEMAKGYFDLKKDTLVVCEPVLTPVYTETPEKVWENVVKVNRDGTPKRIELRDKYELLVGVDTYEEGKRTSRSWRLKKSLYETWDPEEVNWNVQMRGWTPKKSLLERITA